MMTIRVRTGQNDLDVCIAALRFACDTGVDEMRTKWFSITSSDGLKWKSLSFGARVLGRVTEDMGLPSMQTADNYNLCSYIGVHFG